MNLKEIERVVASIQTHLFRNSNSFSIGMLKSHFKGAGLQFKEHQVYAPGDDVRFIDWKLSAKSDHTYVKTFEEERNIEINPFLDLSETMLTGYKNVSKLQASIEIICLLYLLADRTKDTVRTVFYTDKAITLPPLSGREGIAVFISQLEKHNVLNSDGRVNFDYEIDEADENKKISMLKALVAKGKEVVLLSDLDGFSNFEAINKLIKRRNLHFFKIQGPLDLLSKYPFNVYVKQKLKKVFTSVSASRQMDLTGKYKILNVKDRYLEEFVREML